MSDHQLTQLELAHAIDLANNAMHTPLWGVSLRVLSELDEDARHEGASLLPPGVRRIGLAIDRPDTLRDVEHPDTIRLVIVLYVVDKGPSLQIDAETLLSWASRIEAAGAPVDDAAGDLSHSPTVRAMGRDKGAAREVAAALAAARERITDVADDVRDAVANVSNWLPIAPDAIVAGTASLYRMPVTEVSA